MNKQELIEKINNLQYSLSWNIPRINKETVLDLIEQLDEPQKVIIPKFVADYIEFKKKYNFHVYGAMRTIEDHYDKRVPEWFYEGNIEKFCLAWIFGYDVEKEKQYLVKAKSIGDHNNYLKYNTNQKHWYFGSRFIYVNDVDTKIHHTRKELEDANFGWVFVCEGIEIEEVE